MEFDFCGLCLCFFCFVCVFVYDVDFCNSWDFIIFMDFVLNCGNF